MRLSTEELQYLEIALWKEQNEKITVRKDQASQKKQFNKMFKTADRIIRKNNRASLAYI